MLPVLDSKVAAFVVFTSPSADFTRMSPALAVTFPFTVNPSDPPSRIVTFCPEIAFPPCVKDAVVMPMSPPVDLMSPDCVSEVPALMETLPDEAMPATLSAAVSSSVTPVEAVTVSVPPATPVPESVTAPAEVTVSPLAVETSLSSRAFWPLLMVTEVSWAGVSTTTPGDESLLVRILTLFAPPSA